MNKEKKHDLKKKTGLLIGRFQPLHLGHLSAIEHSLKEVSILLIGIGSSQHSMARDNPFSLEERIKMLESSVSGNVKIFSVPDIQKDEKWVEHVKKCAENQIKIKNFDVVYTNNPLVKRLFREKGYDVRGIEEKIMISSTEIRRMMSSGEEWEKYVPKGTMDVIKNLGLEKRMK